MLYRVAGLGYPVASYAGALLTRNQHDDFHRDFHLPTAVDLNVLNYRHENKSYKMVLLGDPRLAGPVINDGAACSPPMKSQ
jgi:hypothetical protein